MKVSIAHLSDPHFGTVKPEILRALQSKMLELSPPIIIISGDITQRARFRQFRAARQFVKSLPKSQVFAIPGNHDIPLFNILARFFYPYFGFKKVFKGTLQKVSVHDEIEVFALNSTSRFRHIQGDFDLRKLQRKLAAPSAKSVVRIATFHHPMDCPKRVDIKNLLRGRDETMKILAAHEIDLILGGHIHDPHVSLSTERYPEVARASVISVAGTCLSWRTRADAPNSFHWIEIETDGPKLSISRYDIQSNLEFMPIQVQNFVREPISGWKRID